MVGDDGVGFDVDAVMNGPVEGKFGLLAMGERVAPVHGTGAIEAAPGEGSTVSIEVPYEESRPTGRM
jgi:signal transduction histidine kinase